MFGQSKWTSKGIHFPNPPGLLLSHVVGTYFENRLNLTFSHIRADLVSGVLKISQSYNSLSRNTSLVPLLTCMMSLWIESTIIPNLLKDVSIIPNRCSSSSLIWATQWQMKKSWILLEATQWEKWNVFPSYLVNLKGKNLQKHIVHQDVEATFWI